jgi:ABC-type sugar transport system ATPase subunit
MAVGTSQVKPRYVRGPNLLHPESIITRFAHDVVSLSLSVFQCLAIGIFLISHDIHDVFDLADRVAVMKNGQVVGVARTSDVTKDEVLGMIILGKCPPGAKLGPGAISTN